MGHTTASRPQAGCQTKTSDLASVTLDRRRCPAAPRSAPTSATYAFVAIFMGHLALRTCSGNLNTVSINFNTSVSAQSLDFCLRLLFFFRNRCDYSMYRFMSASRREWRTRWNSLLLTVTGECLVDFYSCNIQQPWPPAQMLLSVTRQGIAVQGRDRSTYKLTSWETRS